MPRLERTVHEGFLWTAVDPVLVASLSGCTLSQFRQAGRKRRNPLHRRTTLRSSSLAYGSSSPYQELISYTEEGLLHPSIQATGKAGTAFGRYRVYIEVSHYLQPHRPPRHPNRFSPPQSPSSTPSTSSARTSSISTTMVRGVRTRPPVSKRVLFGDPYYVASVVYPYGLHTDRLEEEGEGRVGGL